MELILLFLSAFYNEYEAWFVFAVVMWVVCIIWDFTYILSDNPDYCLAGQMILKTHEPRLYDRLSRIHILAMCLFAPVIAVGIFFAVANER
jgi:hypothetical protein